jgi:hypothetical protein
MQLIIPMIIQTIGLDPSRAGWTESASDLSSRDPSGAIQVDAEHPSRQASTHEPSRVAAAIDACRQLHGAG